MDIEEVAHKTPEKINTFQIDPATGLCRISAAASRDAGLKGDPAKQVEASSPSCTRPSSPRT